MSQESPLKRIITTPAGDRDHVERRIICKDGTTMSVQASRSHYSTPRDDYQAPYTKLELGYPSVPPPPYLMEFAEYPDDPTGTLYGYVPAELVLQFVREHGGEV